MEIRHLRYFLAVAEHRHFGRAAKALHMSQPPLSARIKDLEREIGVALFDRSPSGITLTRAGRKLLPTARIAVDAFDQAQRTGRNLRADLATTLRVGIPPDTTTAAIREFINAAKEINSHVTVEVTEASTGEQLAALRQRQLDLGILRHPFPSEGLHAEPPLWTPAGALMSSTHELARYDSLDAKHLSGFPIMLFPRQMAPGLYDETLAQLAAHGLHARTERTATRLLSSLLTTSNAIAIRQAGISTTDDLTWRPIRDLDLVWRTSVAWPISPTVPNIRRYAVALVSALARHDRWKDSIV